MAQPFRSCHKKGSLDRGGRISAYLLPSNVWEQMGKDCKISSREVCAKDITEFSFALQIDMVIISTL